MSRNTVDKVQSRLLLGLLFLVPVALWPNGYQIFTTPKFVVLVIGVSAATGWWALFGSPIVWGRIREPLIPVAAVLVPLTLAWILGPYKMFSLLGDYNRLEGLLPYLLFGLMALVVALSPLTKQSVGATLALAGAVVAAYGIAQRFGVDFIDWTRLNPGSTIGNTNFAGGFLAIVFPLSLSTSITERESRGPWVFILPALIAVGCLVMSSQGGWAALLAGSILWVGLRGGDRHRMLPPTALVAAGVIAAAVASYVVVSVPDEGSPPNTVELRHLWWTDATDMFLESPVTGRGPNAFAIESTRHRNPIDALSTPNERADHPHSLVMAFLANSGLLGALGILVVALWIGRVVIKTDGADLFAVAVASALAAYFVQSLVSLDEMSLRIAFWGLVGATALPSLPPPLKRAVKRKLSSRTTDSLGPPHEPWRWTVAVLCAVPILWAVAYFDSDVSLEHASGGASSAEARQIVETARGLPLVLEFDRVKAFYVAAQARERSSDVTKSELDEAFSYLEQFPEVPGAALYASALTDIGEDEAAAERYEIVSRWDPYNPILRAHYALVLIDVDRPHDAVGLLEELEALVGDRHPAYWGALALARAHAGDEVGAREAADRALFLETEQAEAVEALELLDGDGGA